MAHAPSPAPVVPPARVTPLDLICVAALAALLWWGAVRIAALTHQSLPAAAPASAAPDHSGGH